MADSKQQGQLTWQGSYPIIHEDHGDELDTAAAVHEFRNGLGTQEARDRAHQDYTKARALDAAAHHLLGIRGAHAVGAEEPAMQHGQAYAAAMHAAGADPFAAPPPEVLDRVRELAAKAYAFKAHPADAMFAQQPETADPEDRRLAELMTKLRGLRDRAVAAAKAEDAAPGQTG